MTKIKKINLKNNFNVPNIENLLSRSIDSLDYPLYILDIKDYSLLYANKVALKNKKKEEKYCYQISHNSNVPIDTKDHPCPLKQIKKTKKSVIVEHLHFDKKGKKVFVEVHAHPIFNDKNEIIHILEYSIDISKRRKERELLKESENKLKAIIESIGDAIFIKNKNLEYIHINSRAEKYLDNPKSKIIGKKDESFFSKEEVIQLKRIDRRVLSGELIKEEISRAKENKNTIYINTRSPLIGNNGKVIGICGIAHDITESRKKELELSIKNKMNRDILENSPVGMFVINRDGSVSYVNKTMIEISGTTYENFSDINFLTHKPYKDLGIVNQIKSAFSGSKFKLKEVEYTSLFGKKRTVRNFIGIPLDSEEGLKVLMIVEDITELVEKKEKLKKAAFEWSNTFDSMTTGISIHDRDNVILNANKHLCDILGITKNDLIGKKCFAVFHDLDAPVSGCPLEKTIVSKQKEVFEYFEKKLSKWLLISTSPIFNSKGEVEKVIHVVDNISEKKQRENEIKKRNEELEIFNKIAVNRELRMMELKDEIKKLKEQLKK